MSFPAPNTFADYPLNKAGLLRKDGAWIEAARVDETTLVALFHNKRPLVGAERAVFLAPKAALAAGAAPEGWLFLGVDDARGCAMFAAAIDRDEPPADGRFEDMRAAAMRLPAADTAILGCAKSLFEWHARHGYCANCGAASAMVDAGWRRRCAICAADHFPRVDPVVIMLPVLGDQCCVGRQERFPPGLFSAFAGFVEPGESLEEACARELDEEAGLKAAAVQYLSSQPWPFPSSLMIGLLAEVTHATLTLDNDEIVEAIWLTRDQARDALAGSCERDGRRIMVPPPVAIAHHLLREWAFRS
jgi:NAD+ diphosphatase